jgi:Leucine-rich repeat (LRR) protein
VLSLGTDLVVLSLSHNRLNKVDPLLGAALGALQELYMTSNFIRELPVEMQSLCNLRVRSQDPSARRVLLVPSSQTRHAGRVPLLWARSGADGGAARRRCCTSTRTRSGSCRRGSAG